MDIFGVAVLVFLVTDPFGNIAIYLAALKNVAPERRMRVALRHRGTIVQPMLTHYRHNDLVVDLVTRRVLSRGRDVHLTPTEFRLLARLVRQASACFYASEEWVKENGHPRSAADAANLPFVGAERNGPYLGFLQQHGLPVTEASFSCHAEHSVASWALVRAGMGIGAMMDDIARQTPGVVRVLDDVPPVMFPIWLVSHRELRTSRRIRVVFEALAEGLQQAA